MVLNIFEVHVTPSEKSHKLSSNSQSIIIALVCIHDKSHICQGAVSILTCLVIVSVSFLLQLILLCINDMASEFVVIFSISKKSCSLLTHAKKVIKELQRRSCRGSSIGLGSPIEVGGGLGLFLLIGFTLELLLGNSKIQLLKNWMDYIGQQNFMLRMFCAF